MKYKNIISQLDLGNLPDDEKQKLIEKLSALVEQKVFLRIVNDLSEEKKEEAARIFSEGNDEEKASFFKENVPNFEEIMIEEIGKVKKDLVGFVSKKMKKDLGT